MTFVFLILISFSYHPFLARLMILLRLIYSYIPITFNLLQVIDGADSTLDAMESAPVNPKNRPLNEIRLTHVSLPTRFVLLSVSRMVSLPLLHRRNYGQ